MYLRNLYKKCFFQICLIVIIGEFLANIAKVAFPKRNKSEEIYKKKFNQKKFQ